MQIIVVNNQMKMIDGIKETNVKFYFYKVLLIFPYKLNKNESDLY